MTSLRALLARALARLVFSAAAAALVSSFGLASIVVAGAPNTATIALSPTHGLPGSLFKIAYTYYDSPPNGCGFDVAWTWDDTSPQIPLGRFTTSCSLNVTGIVPSVRPWSAPGKHHVCAVPINVSPYMTITPPKVCATYTIPSLATPKPTLKPTPKPTPEPTLSPAPPTGSPIAAASVSSSTGASGTVTPPTSPGTDQSPLANVADPDPASSNANPITVVVVFALLAAAGIGVALLSRRIRRS